jgi:transcriptional regulator with XRE-family HTH domain
MLMYPEFRNLLMSAIGKDRKKQEFAFSAGLSVSHLSRLLNNDDIHRPSRSTLRKIALASNGKVDYLDLLQSCGYSADQSLNRYEPSGFCSSCDNEEAVRITQAFRNRILSKYCLKNVSMVKSHSLTDLFDGILSIYRQFIPYQFKLVITDCNKYYGNNHAIAEEYANIIISYESKSLSSEGNRYKCEFGFVAYFCVTEGGCYILSDVAFDLPSLIDSNHPLGIRKSKEIAADPNSNSRANVSEVVFVSYSD